MFFGELISPLRIACEMFLFHNSAFFTITFFKDYILHWNFSVLFNETNILKAADEGEIDIEPFWSNLMSNDELSIALMVVFINILKDCEVIGDKLMRFA